VPLTHLSVPAHLSAAQVRSLADAVHDGLVTTCNVPEDDRFQLVSRFAPDAMMLNPTFGQVRRTADASVVEITFLSGRTEDQKRKLFKQVVERAVRAGFVADDILIALTENGKIDWSLGRGQAFADHQSA
jgi:phenylpyruvate tautomerase PptA (4-oxalocrotonate tautomerase family)